MSDPTGWTMAPGGPASAFVAPAARDHGVPVAAVGGLRSMGIGGAMGAEAPAPDGHAAAWAAASEQVLSNTEKQDKLYAAYQVRKKGKGHPQPLWWEGNNNKGGAKRTVEGGLGEYQADRLFNAQGHEKLNHGGQLVDLEEPPKGKGLDGVWKNAAPPPMYLITETKFTTTPDKVVALSSGGQLSDPWILAGNRLENALGRVEGGRMRKAMRNSDMVGRRLLHVDSDGYLHEYEVDDKGKFDLSKPLKKLKV